MSTLKQSLKQAIKKIKHRRNSTVKQTIHFSQGLGRLEDDGPYLFRFMFQGEIKRGSTGCFEFVSAKKWLLKYRSELSLNSIDLKEEKETKKLSEVLSEWIAWNTKKKASSYISETKARLNLHVINVIGDKPLRLLTNSDLKQIVSKYMSKHEPSGANNLLLQLSSVLSFAREEGYSVPIIKMPRQKIQEKDRKYIPKDKIAEFLTAIDAENNLNLSILTRFMLLCGLRETEARTIKWSQIDFVSQTLTKDKQKNKKVSIKPLPASIIPFLLKAQNIKVKTFRVCPGNDLEGCMSGTALKKHLAEVSLKVFGYKLASHSLRRSFITNLSLSGVSTFTLMSLADHADIKTTARYVQKSALAEREAVDLMDSFGA